MKLLFAYIVPSGGMETLNRLRCLFLKKAGIHCHLLYLYSGAGLQNIRETPVTVANDDESIRRLLTGEAFDAIIVSSDTVLLGRLRLLGYTGPIIYEAQGLGTWEQACQAVASGYLPIHAYANAVLLPHTSHLIGLFHGCFPGKPLFHFHNCIDTERFHYEAMPPVNYPVIGWVGRMEPNKNWRGLLGIVQHLLKPIPSLKLWIFDDPSLSTEEAQFVTVVHELGLEHALVRYSNVAHPDMPKYYSRIGDSGGFLCSTSRVEGFGYAVLEALACRCPVLATDSDGVRSFILHNVTGKTIPHDDIQGAVTEALELMSQPALREDIRTKGLAHVRQHFSPEQYLNQFMAMLRSIGVLY